MCLSVMNNTKHTPGPWSWDGEFALGWYASVNSESKYVGHYARPQGLSKEESEANARLFTAAPDLLAACEALLPHMDQLAMPDPMAVKAEELARAAIAKAKGGV